MRQALTVLSLALLLVNVAAAADSLDVRLIGGCDTPAEAYSVAVSDGYAYVADCDSGLRVISVADPANPVEVGHAQTAGKAYGVAFNDGYAFVAAGDSGLRVVSVSDPAHPMEVGHCGTHGSAWRVTVAGDYAYVAADTAGLRTVSVADPENPIEVGHCDTPSGALGVVLSGDYAYVAGGAAGFSVISVVDPAHPAIVVNGGYVWSASALGIAVSGDYIYVSYSDSGLHVFSYSESTSVRSYGKRGTFRWSWEVAIMGGSAFVAADEAGLRVLSVVSPMLPDTLWRYYDMSGWANGLAVSGDQAYVAYGDRGLQIFQYYVTGVEESNKPQASSRRPDKTLLSRLPPGAEAFDVMGRRVVSPDPGVYFVRCGPSAVTKVVITH